MSFRLRQATVLTALTAACAAYAGDIEGTVVIHRRLSKRTIIAPVSAYQRGVAVNPEPDAEQDPLEFERSHAVIYVAWHKAAGFFRQTVRVDSRRPAEIEFLIPFEESVLASDTRR